MDDHATPHLCRVFATGRFVWGMWRFVLAILPQGIVIFKNANPHLPPLVVVGHYIDK